MKELIVKMMENLNRKSGILNNIHNHGMLCFFVLAIAGMTACNESDDEEQNPFDRKAMLTHFADELVVPAYENLHSKTVELGVSVEGFLNSPTAESLDMAQNAWVEAYSAWQSANAYNFGPAGESGLRKGLIEEIGTFPVSAAKMNDALETAEYNLNDFNRDARGFLAVEFLLFHPSGNDAMALEKFSNPNAALLLTDLVANINSRVSGVLDEWNTGFRSDFINNNGTDVGSSTSKFYNEFVRSFEALKNFKMGLPLGLQPGQLSAAPELTEAYYSGKSAEMIALHTSAIENIWYGRNAAGVDGLGFDDYLATVVGGAALIESTKAQLAAVNVAIGALPLSPKFSEQVVSQPEAGIALHTELQKQTRFFKSDMSSLLGLAITFSSGDGD